MSMNEPSTMMKWIREQSPKARIAWLVAALAAVWFLGSCASSIFYERDCRHFGTHSDAQRFYHLTGGPILDFHGLDGDNDGSACERLP